MKPIALFITVSVLLAFPSNAANPTEGGIECELPMRISKQHREYVENLENNVYKNWCCSNKNFPNRTIVTVDIADDGLIYNPRLQESCGDPQLDAECIEAVCGSSPTA